MSYYGGIDFDKWFARVMAADSNEVKKIRAEFEDVIKRQAETEAAIKDDKIIEEPHRRISNEKKVHPQVIVQGNYYE